MMKKGLLFVALLLAMQLGTFGQTKLITKTGHVWFNSKTPTETIEAHSRQAVSLMEMSNGNIAIEIPIMSFVFPKTLMQEHFNETYMQSRNLPKAKFSGKIINLNEIRFATDGTYNAIVEGDLTIHGVTKKVKQTGSIVVSAGGTKMKVTSQFKVAPRDYNIVIESRFANNIAALIDVNVDIDFTK